MTRSSLCVRFPALDAGYIVFAASSDWFIALLTSFAIGQSEYFGFYLTTFIENSSFIRKSTHTDRYPAYDSNFPRSVKRDIVKRLYDQANRPSTKPHGMSKEKKHLPSVRPPTLCRRSPTQEKLPPAEIPRQSLNPLPSVYPTSREYWSLFAAAKNNKAFAPSLSPTLHLGPLGETERHRRSD